MAGLYSPSCDLVNTNMSVKIKKGNFPLIHRSFERAGVATRDKIVPYGVLKTALKTVGEEAVIIKEDE